MTDKTDNALFAYSPITERPPIHWPGGARVAFYVGLNIEHFHLDRPSTTLFEATAALVPDVLNYGWRDYGTRVGIWRVIESLDRHGIRASALVNSEVPERYPQIVEAGRARDWAWLAHGRTNSDFHSGLSADAVRGELTEIVETIEEATGRRPRGWMGPGLSETFHTPALLAELGLSYVAGLDGGTQDADWTGSPSMKPRERCVVALEPDARACPKLGKMCTRPSLTPAAVRSNSSRL